MNARRALISYFVVVLISMTWVSWYASTTPTITSLPAYAARTGKEAVHVFDGFVTVCSEPWGLATMFDAYFGFFTFWLYTAWRERTWLARLGWLMALLIFGNFAIAAYALLCLFCAGENTSFTHIFFTRK